MSNCCWYYGCICLHVKSVFDVRVVSGTLNTLMTIRTDRYRSGRSGTDAEPSTFVVLLPLTSSTMAALQDQATQAEEAK